MFVGTSYANDMIRQFLILVGVIAVILTALLLSLYVLDFLNLPDLRHHLSRTFSIIGICTTAGLLILLLVRVGERK